MDRLLLPTILLSLMAYLVCGIPFGMIIARVRGIDVRQTGSGNIGATNVGRSLGAKAAALTLLLDAGKGYLCMVAASQYFFTFGGEMKAFYPGQPFDWCLTCVYAACVLGHVFSPYLRFHGGKGISVGFGAALGLNPVIAFGLLAVFLLFALPTRYVSLGSICAAASLSIWCLVVGYSVQAIAPMTLVAVAVIWAHRSNIQKLVNHQEKKFSFGRGDADAGLGDEAASDRDGDR